MKRLILLLLAIGVCCSATAKVVLPKVLGSNMVLQQSTEIELWGKAEAMKRVTVELSWMKSKIKTQADIQQSHLTVGAYIFQALLADPKQKIKGKLVRTIERDLSTLQKKGVLKREGKDNDGVWVVDG